MRILRSRLFINAVILLALFIVSVLVRLDNLKDPLGRHHEWVTGHVLSTVYRFEQDGVATHYGAPVWTFNTPGDRAIAASESFKDKNNFKYYVSYPPLCFLLPHWIFTISGTHASVIGIRIIGLAIHFLVAFLVYLIVMKLFDRKMRDCIFVPAIFAFGLYMFAAGNLWFHAHVFFADMLVPLFIACFLYVFLRVLKNELSTWKACTLLFISCALGAYTEWQMLFVAFFVAAVLFFKGFRERRYFLFFLTVCIAALLPVLIAYMQYSSIAGSAKLIEAVSSKYKLRRGTSSKTSEAGMGIDNSFSLQNISGHYERNYSLLLDYGWYALLLFVFLFVVNRWLDKGAMRLHHFLLFAILLASILLHQYVFFNFTALHDFSTLKTALFVSLFCGYVLGLLFVIFDLDKKKRKRTVVVGLLTAAFGVFSFFSWKSYNRVNERSSLDQNQMIIGEIVHRHIKPDEIIFSITPASPEAQWYAKRNFITCSDIGDAVHMLKDINPDLAGQVIRLNAIDYEVFRINTKGDTTGYVKDNYGNLECLKNFRR